MATMTSPLLLHLMPIFLIFLFLYGLYLAIRLIFYAEWQWFCLPLVGLLPAFIGAGVMEIMDKEPLLGFTMPGILVWSFLASIFVSLLSGFVVYWLMNKHRQQKIFIHFYAFFYFYTSLVQAGFLMSRFMQSITGSVFFLHTIQLLFLYGIVVAIWGIGSMHYRLRQLKAENKE